MRELVRLGYITKNYTYLDFGCGRAFDVEFLKNSGINIDGYDKFSDNACYNTLKNNKYDFVICNYVLNVIKDLKEHEDVIKQLRSLSKNVIITVRSDFKAIKPTWEYIDKNECYKTPKGSYQRFYNKELIHRLIGDVEYILENNSYIIFKLI